MSDKHPVDIDKIVQESRMKNMARNLPKKQGRMFGIELGQNVSTTIHILNQNINYSSTQKLIRN